VGVTHHKTRNLGAVDVDGALMLALGAPVNLPVMVATIDDIVPRANHGRYHAIMDYLESEFDNFFEWSDKASIEEVRSVFVRLADRILTTCGPDETTARYLGHPVVALEESGLDLGRVEQLLSPLEGLGDEEF
jgi:hypothetical protein